MNWIGQTLYCASGINIPCCLIKLGNPFSYHQDPDSVDWPHTHTHTCARTRGYMELWTLRRINSITQMWHHSLTGKPPIGMLPSFVKALPSLISNSQQFIEQNDDKVGSYTSRWWNGKLKNTLHFQTSTSICMVLTIRQQTVTVIAELSTL